MRSHWTAFWLVSLCIGDKSLEDHFMCGIVGIISFKRNSPSDEGSQSLAQSIHSMIETLNHRGPDSSGHYFAKGLNGNPPIALGHARLKIIDLSDRGHQPMESENGRYVLVYNGEIYNYIELRSELRSLGHVFRSETDTEVVLRAFMHWGENCLDRFNGMWAFAIYDNFTGRLFLSRDRFGIKPLYYCRTDDAFVFASEIKALFVDHLVTAEPNHRWIFRFVTKGAVDWDDSTAFNSVYSLLPGHNLTIESNGSISQTRYWNLADCAEDEESAEHTFRNLLDDAVRLRLLRSDVPVGTCLSGGLDSSSIVALACNHLNTSMKTFSADYSDPDCTERHYIDLMAQKFPIQSHIFSPCPNSFWDTLDRIVWHQDEPFTTYGVFSQWFVFEEVAKQVRVALDGQGGDELLGGYYYYFESALNDLFNRALASRDQAVLKQFWTTLEEAEELTGINLYDRLRRSYYPALKNRDLFTLDYEREFGSFSEPENVSDKYFSEDLNQTLYCTFRRTSLPALLHNEDRMSMAFSVEARVPFLDYRLVEFCFNLPASWKIHGTTTKRLLRHAMKEILPDELIGRRDKKGYATPVARWLRNGLREDVKELIRSDAFTQRGIFNQEKVLGRFNDHVRGHSDYTWEIWRWISLEMWFREFIDTQ